MRGRKPTPTALKLLRGNPGKRAINREEPELDAKPPEPPTWIEGDALDKWREMTALLTDTGILTRVDGDLLTYYCETWAEWKEAKQKSRSNKVVKAPSGYPILNPYVSIANRALARLQSLGAEFGMTPSARSRIRAVKGGKKSDAAKQRERFFGIVTGDRR